jgi:hypothetical protein
MLTCWPWSTLMTLSDDYSCSRTRHSPPGHYVTIAQRAPDDIPLSCILIRLMDSTNITNRLTPSSDSWNGCLIQLKVTKKGHSVFSPYPVHAEAFTWGICHWGIFDRGPFSAEIMTMAGAMSRGGLVSHSAELSYYRAIQWHKLLPCRVWCLIVMLRSDFFT